MDAFNKILEKNQSWAAAKVAADPEFFQRLSNIQRPDFLWIGCSDSRVPANEVTDTQPGEIFVHRNIANLVVNTDLNLLSVLKYAVNYLKVKHIIVCGHYGCGGIKAAMSNEEFGLLNKWLRNIKDVYRFHNEELDAIDDDEARTNRLVELNVLEQVKNLAKTTIVQRAWHTEQPLMIHGCVYGLDNGTLKEVVTMHDTSLIKPIYQYQFSKVEKDV